MILNKYDFDSVQKHLQEFSEHVYKESGEAMTMICILSDDKIKKNGFVSSDGGSTPYLLATSPMRLLPENTDLEELFTLMKEHHKKISKKPLRDVIIEEL